VSVRRFPSLCWERDVQRRTRTIVGVLHGNPLRAIRLVGRLTVPSTRSAIASDGMRSDMARRCWVFLVPCPTSFANSPKKTCNRCRSRVMQTAHKSISAGSSSSEPISGIHSDSLAVKDANGLLLTTIYCRDDLKRWSFGHSKLTWEDAGKIAKASSRIPEFMMGRRGSCA
jgi:hypothetical protein